MNAPSARDGSRTAPASATSAATEALLLPVLLLGASLLAAVRVSADGALTLVGPSLFGLVMGAALCLVSLRAGLVDAARLVSSRRTALANANGVVALLALLFAAGQVFTLLMPEAGLLALLLGTFYVAMLAQAALAQPDGPRLLRSLMVLFAAGLLLRFAVLNGLAGPGDSLARRAFASLVDGLTPGGLGLEHFAPATGYTAFVALLLFVGAIALMPGAHGAWSLLGAQGPSGERE